MRKPNKLLFAFLGLLLVAACFVGYTLVGDQNNHKVFATVSGPAPPALDGAQTVLSNMSTTTTTANTAADVRGEPILATRGPGSLAPITVVALSDGPLYNPLITLTNDSGTLAVRSSPSRPEYAPGAYVAAYCADYTSTAARYRYADIAGLNFNHRHVIRI